jgi:hypothetical protein
MFGNTLFESPALLNFDHVASPYNYNQNVLEGNFLGKKINPGTQKAKGLFFLQGKLGVLQNALWSWSVPKHLLFKSGLSFDDGSFNFPVFARPCPVNPRHGFVDSTVCNNAEELNKISSAAYDAEEKAELLVTKPVSSHYNAIINGNVITFASGNDGATAGRDCKYFYISDDPLSSLLGLENGIVADGETPFYEIVFSSTDTSHPVNLVQVRSAPKTPRVKDFVPAQVTVKTILKAEGDLLEWESLLKTVDPKTTIVDHTNGSLSSHYAIHAIVNKVAIFTTYLPQIGSVVEPTVENQEVTEADKNAFRQAFSYGFVSAFDVWSKSKYQNGGGDPTWVMGNIVRVAIAALHNFSSIALSKDYQMLGMILGLFTRVTFAVSMGESRYNHKRSDKFPFFKDYFASLPNSGRSGCYTYSMNLETDKVIASIASAYHAFRMMQWDNSYGGKKWAACTNSAIALFNACLDADLKLVVELFNKVINENHNGGKYLNKVVAHNDFDEGSTNPSLYTLKQLQHVVDILSTAWDLSKEELTKSKASFVKKIDLTWTERLDVPTPYNKAKNIYVEATSDPTISAITVIDHAGVTHSIQIPPVTNPFATNCACSSCVPSKKFDVHSIPFWFVLPGGEGLISKAKFNKLLEKQGIAKI